MNVLSLFDGISCGQVALERAGIGVEKYFSSEIDKSAIQVTQKNYPNTIQLGDVRNVDFKQFEGKIDLLIGGSPCQDFSTLGKRQGLEGDKSSLFYDYLRALQDAKPRYFLLENNANMPIKAKDTISSLLEVEPVEINSKLFVQQNRNRLYWCNWGFKYPSQVDYNEILEDNHDEIDLVPFVENKIPKIIDKYGYLPKKFNPYNMAEINEIYPCLTAQGNSQTKSSTVILNDNHKFSKLSPIEWERLQTLPDDYTKGVSDAQRYKCIGNGWTIDVIAYILKELKAGQGE